MATPYEQVVVGLLTAMACRSIVKSGAESREADKTTVAAIEKAIEFLRSNAKEGDEEQQEDTAG